MNICIRSGLSLSTLLCKRSVIWPFSSLPEVTPNICRKLNDRLKITKVISMSTMAENPLVAVCQMTSKSDKEENFRICKSLIEKATSRGAKMVYLPECFDHISESKEQALQQAESLEGPLISKYKELALLNSVWLSLGGFHEKGPAEDSKRVSNAHIIISNTGSIAAVYRKVHLFNIDVPGGVRLRESDYTIPGNAVLKPINTPVGKVGLGICYDLRFPEFSLSLARAGADILTYPSAFTQTTGMAHWESLLRTRAIESQCYVIAAAQTGKHNQKRSSYGHAMIVDPWGCVVACCKEGSDVALAEIDLQYLKKVRTEMPVWHHRRPDLYGEVPVAGEGAEDLNVQSTYQFGHITLSSSQLFYKTSLSMAFVNKKPVLPGHILVAPLRCAERFCDLTSEEIADVFSCVQKVQKIVEAEHNASSSTVTIQDGSDAGQSIKHVHVHILPRKPGDFERNDDIYYKLQTHDKTETGKWRNDEDMAVEADKLRRYLYS